MAGFIRVVFRLVIPAKFLFVANLIVQAGEVIALVLELEARLLLEDHELLLAQAEGVRESSLVSIVEVRTRFE